MAFDIPLAAEIWAAKYRFAPDAGGGDATVEDSWRRVAEAIAEAEPAEAREAWREKFLDALGDFQFMPAGRIFAGAGTGRAVTLFNCFVMGTLPDDLPGIFEHLREAAVTLQQGGASAWTSRPSARPARRCAASGPTPRVL